MPYIGKEQHKLERQPQKRSRAKLAWDSARLSRRKTIQKMQTTKSSFFSNKKQKWKLKTLEIAKFIFFHKNFIEITKHFLEKACHFFKFTCLQNFFEFFMTKNTFCHKKGEVFWEVKQHKHIYQDLRNRFPPLDQWDLITVDVYEASHHTDSS